MKNTQKLINVVAQHPESRIMFMYSSGGNDDYAYTLGEIQKIEVTETTMYNDERVFFRDEYDELLETIKEDIYFERYIKVLNDEEYAELEQLAKDEIAKYDWEPVIVVYVGN